MEVNTKCCNKEMTEIVADFSGDINTIMLKRFVCLECGALTDIKEYSLDDEELFNELECANLTDNKIYKELKSCEEIRNDDN